MRECPRFFEVLQDSHPLKKHIETDWLYLKQLTPSFQLLHRNLCQYILVKPWSSPLLPFRFRIKSSVPSYEFFRLFFPNLTKFPAKDSDRLFPNVPEVNSVRILSLKNSRIGFLEEAKVDRTIEVSKTISQWLKRKIYSHPIKFKHKNLKASQIVSCIKESKWNNYLERQFGFSLEWFVGSLKILGEDRFGNSCFPERHCVCLLTRLVLFGGWCGHDVWIVAGPMLKMRHWFKTNNC